MGLDYAAIGRRIKAARVKQDMTQEELAELVQVSTAHISKIETAYTKPSFQVVVDIANALQTSVDELLVDNVTYPSVHLHKDFEPLLEEMTVDELRIMRDTMKTLRQSLLTYRKRDQ